MLTGCTGAAGVPRGAAPESQQPGGWGQGAQPQQAAQEEERNHAHGWCGGGGKLMMTAYRAMHNTSRGRLGACGNLLLLGLVKCLGLFLPSSLQLGHSLLVLPPHLCVVHYVIAAWNGDGTSSSAQLQRVTDTSMHAPMPKDHPACSNGGRAAGAGP